MKKPLVSIVIPTKESAKYLTACLKSIKDQSYKNIEIVVVDNSSKDQTLQIAQKFSSKIYQKGSERSIQRNYGVKKSKGDYVFFVDSDMELTPKVVQECIDKVFKDKKIKALIIPEESRGVGFWADCKYLERSFYVGVDFMEAARFFEKSAFLAAGGYDENLVSGEDWYLSQKIEKMGEIARVASKIFHNEGNLSLLLTVKKKFYYARHFTKYVDLKENIHLKKQISLFKRYTLFFSNPQKLLKNPILGLGMLFMKTCEFAAGGVGYAISLFEQKAFRK